MRKINEMAMENIIVIKFKDGKNYAKLLPDGSFGILNEDESFKVALPFRDGFGLVCRNSGIWNFVDVNGNIVLEDSFWSKLSSGNKKVNELNKLYNTISGNGAPVIEEDTVSLNIYDSSVLLEYMNGHRQIRKKDGTLIYDLGYKKVFYDQNNKMGCVYEVEFEDGSINYLDLDGKFKFKENVADLSHFDDRFKIAYVKKTNGLKNIVNTNGDFISKNDFKVIYPFSEQGLAKVLQVNDKYNFIKLDGTLLLKNDLHTTDFFNMNGKMFVAVKTSSGNFELLKADGSIICKEDIKNESDTFNFKLIPVLLANGRYNYIGEDLKLLSSEDFNDVEAFMKNGIARVLRTNGLWNYIKTDGSLLADKDFYFADTKFKNGKICVEVERDRYNYLKEDGTFFLSRNFKSMGNFNSFDVAIVEVDTRIFNIINNDGEFISKIDFKEINYFNEYGLSVVVLLDGKYNMLRVDGTLMFEKSFFHIGMFLNEKAKVKVNDEEFNFLNPDGSFLLEHNARCRKIICDASKLTLVNHNGLLNYERDDKIMLSKEDFKEIRPFDENGLARVRRTNGLLNFLKFDGSLLSNIDFLETGELKYNMIYVLVKEPFEFNYLKLNGTLFCSRNFTAMSVFDKFGIATIMFDDFTNFVNKEGEIISKEDFVSVKDFTSCKLALVERKVDSISKPSYNYLKFDGTLLLKENVKWGESFYENGIAPVITSDDILKFIKEDGSTLKGKSADLKEKKIELIKFDNEEGAIIVILSDGTCVVGK